jgi:hypothetical protein
MLEPTHVPPVQHSCPIPPQGSHVAPLQAVVPKQRSITQHAAPAAPQPGTSHTDVLEHSSPPRHVPPQQPSPRSSHGPEPGPPSGSGTVYASISGGA